MKNNNLKVAVLTKYFLPVAGGIEHNIAKTYSEMQRSLGWEVTIHTSKDNYTKKNILTNEDNIEGIRVRRYKWGNLGFWPSIDFSKIDVVALHNFDIFPHFQLMVFVLFLKLIGRKKFVLFLTPHGGYNPNWPTFDIISRIIKWIYTYTIGALLINLTVDGVRAVSPWEKSEEEKTIKMTPVRLIENGLEEVAYENLDILVNNDTKSKVASWGEYVFSNCRLYKIKNMENMYRAFSLLPTHYKLVHIGTIQDEEYKAMLDDLAEKLNISDRIIYLGVVRGAEKYYITKHAKMMIHLAWWESGCNVLREGMSQGLPLVTSNTYGVPGIVKNKVNGYTVDPADWNAAGEALKHIDKNYSDDEIQKMRALNIQSQRDITWSNVAKKMDAFYRELVLKISRKN